MKPDRTPFQNLAGVRCDNAIWAELRRCGALAVVDPRPQSQREPITSFGGQVGVWSLTRLWTYWSATSSFPFSAEWAEKLNKEWGTQVRAYGFAGGTDIDPKRLPDCYHIDTEEGLQEFAHLAVCQSQEIGSQRVCADAAKGLTGIQYQLTELTTKVGLLQNQLRWAAGER